MPAYVVGEIHITDPVSYLAHVPIALATVARFGGRIVAGGGKIELLDGGPMPERIVVIEFPDAETARRWYRSDDYQAALKVRLSTSQGRVFLIDGVEPSLRPLAAPRGGLKGPDQNEVSLHKGLSSPPRKRGSRGNCCGLAAPGFPLSR